MAGKNLVIVESPAKAKTIGKILGKDYTVTSSKGHIRDLPENRLGVDVKRDFAPQYVVVGSRKKIVAELRAAAKNAEAVYLCPDPDREGEAIAWHLKELLADVDGPREIYRVQYNEITPRAVRAAFDAPSQIDMHRVDAQQARRVLDRIVGYTVSPLLWRRLRRGLSAGRVQSVALKLLCDREREIRDFVPEAFWIMGALVRKLVVPLEPFNIRLARIDGKKAEIKAEEQAAAIAEELKTRSLRVREIKTREVTRRAPPPFITSTLQQAGSSSFGYSPSRTMQIAQKLYEGVALGSGPVGLITYMRTDSVNVSREAKDACRAFVADTYGPDFVPEKPNAFRSRAGAQEAHEAIRPTDVTRTPESLKKKLDSSEMKIYESIWKRFVASQMAPARFEQKTVEIDAVSESEAPAEGREYVLTASASQVLFAGYMRVNGPDRATDSKKKEGEEDEPQALPPLSEGERLVCLEWLSERKETQPPPRFSEASLVRELERNGVGRPSTYAATISTLHQRDYAVREKRTLSPTELGFQVNDLLQQDLPKLFDVGFTAQMEESLDQIENGDVKWTDMLRTFYEQFDQWMEGAREPPADSNAVRDVLKVLEGVNEWAPPVKRGKRVFSDEKFVASIQKQLDEGKKPFSQRQFEAVVRIALRYKDQLPEAVAVATRLGQGDMLNAPETQPPREATLRKLALLSGIELDESTTEFVESLRGRAMQKRSLTEAQLRALNRVVSVNAARIPDYESIKEELDVVEEKTPESAASRLLIEAMRHVKEWNPPTTKKDRTFDDSKFFESLSGQFEQRGFLSFRQLSALKRMASRYKSQIPDYAELAEAAGLAKKKKRRDGDD